MRSPIPPRRIPEMLRLPEVESRTDRMARQCSDMDANCQTRRVKRRHFARTARLMQGQVLLSGRRKPLGLIWKLVEQGTWILLREGQMTLSDSVSGFHASPEP